MNLTISAPLNFMSYGLASLNICLALEKKGVNLSLFPIGPVQVEPQHIDSVKKWVQNAQSWSTEDNCIRIFHQFSLAERYSRWWNVGFPIFELNKFNEVEKHHLRSREHLFVCSKWAADIVSSEVDMDADVVTLGVDRSIFHEGCRQFDDTTRFLVVGKAEVRKSHPELLECFDKAFTVRDKVSLTLSWENPFFSPEEWAKWEGLLHQSRGYKDGQVQSIGRFSTQKEMADLYRAHDCLLAPSKAEGFDLPLLEAMSCGLECIATDYSAHTEFACPNNTRLIAIDRLVPAHDGKWFFGQGEWADFGPNQKEQLVEHMRAVHKDKKLNVGGIVTAKGMSWDRTAGLILNSRGGR